MEHSPVAVYREYEPCEALRPYVRAFFTFTPAARGSSNAIRREVVFGESDSYCSPMFADGHGSIVCTLERTCDAGRWRPGAQPRAEVIGAVIAARETAASERAEMAGVYFRAAGLSRLAGVAASELADNVVSLNDIWGKAGGELVSCLVACGSETAQIERLQSELLARMGGDACNGIDATGLASWAVRRRGQLTVHEMAGAAGVSRQHLTRVFRERVGITPKLYCRLARFHAALAYAARPAVDWAQAAAHLGYADQSHMIADFREFSTLTPHMLASGRWFHPFMERARGRNMVI